MNLQPEDPSPDNTAIADASSRTDGSSIKIASASIPVAHQPDSLFLSLPLELRFIIYEYTMKSESIAHWSPTYVPYDQPQYLKAMVRLSGISRQIRCEMDSLLAEKSLSIQLDMTMDREVIPEHALHKYPEAYENGSGEWKGLNLDAPRTFKFWTVGFLAWSTSFPGLFFAAIDFGDTSVIDLSARKAEPPYVEQKRESVTPAAMQKSRESLTKSMQAVVEQEGFDGFTFGDMHLLLRNLKISVPEPSGDWSLMFENADVVSAEKDEE